MRSITSIAIAASLAAGVVAQPHNHRHHHVKKDAASPIGKRDVVVVYENGPTVTTYELGGTPISEEEAKKGIQDGLYVVIGETTPSSSPLPPASTSKSPQPSKDAQFFEAKVEKSTPSPTPTPTPTPTPSPSPSSKAAPTSTASPSGGSSGGGVDSEFPSGTIPCSHFPSDYGAVPVDYLGTGGWTGIQKTPDYSIGDAVISFIETAVSGDSSCPKKSFCSYSCGVGYQKTQWPSAQGATKQSIGGIYCNSNGFLELTRPEKTTLCEPGAGGVTVKNDLDQQVSVCRTDYPGTESMVIATVPQPGQTLELTNPLSSDYYVWDGSPTTAQYYVNKAGYSAEDSCVWKSSLDPLGAGNWAPINVGTGKSADGNTYISIFNNAPTSVAKLDFNVEIVGDVNSKCALIDGVYTGGGTGCTTAISGNGKATIRFFK
ncbi:beta-glucosidase [Colletotrichum graminicola]|uniref:Beta-glucosidase n=1 Tax=Colletotrichum graminicola (strain M1.001 / M2 / FGSC 10212) TaxID=645133 RepID=E3QEF5_COLGM|nr:beta-glucosidase [Colletotrichum graminicola M1.001]EFQ29261.1 beta-glucosidase [Colletotrichum graminicola M1.001]WDK13663.1 beta-glucosidase [Colletotrichum graminicola]